MRTKSVIKDSASFAVKICFHLNSCQFDEMTGSLKENVSLKDISKSGELPNNVAVFWVNGKHALEISRPRFHRSIHLRLI